MHLKEFLPAACLSEYVHLYRIIDFEFQDNNPIPAKTYPPRPEQCLQFFPTTTHIFYPESNTTICPKDALFIGQHTIINSRTVYKKFLSLQVVFQPGMLYRLLGIPQALFSNQAIEASDVFGSDIALVNEQLYYAGSNVKMIEVVERFLMTLTKKIKKDAHALDKAIKFMVTNPGDYTLDKVIKNVFLSHRQFDRKFTERVGIGAKEFLRVSRFYNAYLTKNKYPAKDWLTIALHCGYYDYQHLSKDYKDFTGYTPAQFFALDSPERRLGIEETY